MKPAPETRTEDRTVETIEALLARVEALGARVRLKGASIDVDVQEFHGGSDDLEELDRRRQELLGLLAARRSRPPLPQIRKHPPVEEASLASAQEPWADIDGPPLHEQWLPILWNLQGRLDVPAFQRSYRRLFEMHDILRARYVYNESGLRQQIAPAGETRLDVVDLSNVQEQRAELEIWRRLKPTYEKPTPINRGAVKLTLYRLSERRHILGGFVHHIVFDGRSQQIFIGELMGRYYAYLLGKDAPDAGQLQYSDFVAWEQEWLTPDERMLASAYWDYALAKAKELQLSGDRGSGSQASAMGMVSFAISEALLASATAFSRSQGVSLNIFFLAMLSLLLGRWAGRKEALFGHLIHGRPSAFDNVVGCFMQTRPFYLDFGDDPTMTELLARTRGAYAASSDLRRPLPPQFLNRLNFSSVLVNYNIKMPRGAGRNSSLAGPGGHNKVAAPALAASNAEIHSSAFDRPMRSFVRPSDLLAAIKDEGAPEAPESASLPGHSRDLLGLRCGMVQLPRRLQTTFSRDLHWAVSQTASSLSGRITYARDRLSHDRIVALATDLAAIMKAAIRSPDLPISQIDPDIGQHV